MAALQKADLLQALRGAGVREGDLAFLHVDVAGLMQLGPMDTDKRLGLLFEAIREVVGPSGTAMVPAFSYSFCKNEVFDPVSTPSSGVGAFSEFFRKQPGVLRSPDPIFSVVAIGAEAAKMPGFRGENSFGEDSLFAYLMEKNAKILCFGCSMDRITFVHYCEQKLGVPYRYIKEFPGTVIEPGGAARSMIAKYFVRDLSRKFVTDLSQLRKRLQGRGRLNVAEFGRVAVVGCTAQHFFEEAKALVGEEPGGLIREEQS